MGKKRIIQKGVETLEPKEGGERRPAEISVSQGIVRGIAHIRATYNNTLIVITDEKGNTLAWSSAGAIGFAGARKATPFAAARVAETVMTKLRRTGLRELNVRVSGVGSGRDSAVRALANQGMNITSIRDVTPLPHNGPRPKKVRRV